MGEDVIIFGYPISLWDKVVLYAIILSGFTGFLSVISALVSGVVGYKISNVVQEQSKIEIARASTKAEESKAIAAEANEKAEREKLERLTLEAKIAPRRLTNEMQRLLSSDLSLYRAKKVVVKSYALDVESAVLGKQIIASLQASGIEAIDSILSESSLGGVILGVSITGSNQQLVQKISTSLSTICNLRTHSTPISRGPGMCTGDMESEADADAIVFIGVKPIQ